MVLNITLAKSDQVIGILVEPAPTLSLSLSDGRRSMPILSSLHRWFRELDEVNCMTATTWAEELRVAAKWANKNSGRVNAPLENSQVCTAEPFGYKRVFEVSRAASLGASSPINDINAVFSMCGGYFSWVRTSHQRRLAVTWDTS